MAFPEEEDFEISADAATFYLNDNQKAILNKHYETFTSRVAETGFNPQESAEVFEEVLNEIEGAWETMIIYKFLSGFFLARLAKSKHL